MGSHHAFDWKGFAFAVKILFLCVTIGVAGNLVVGYASALTAVVPPSATADLQKISPPPPEKTVALSLSTTTPERIIATLSITDAVPPTGKFIAADLTNMMLTLYQDGTIVGSYPILTKGRPGSPYSTPSGFYTLLSKEPDHFNNGEQIHMPWSMQFYGNYFIHGWPFNVDGTPVNPNYSGGCIRLSTDDAQKVYDFASTGTGIFVYDTAASAPLPPVVLANIPAPSVSAASYVVADIDTGDVYLERDAAFPRPIASVTKLMTALVANETIMFNEKVGVTRGELLHMASTTGPTETFFVDDLFYPLLMESNNAIAERLAEHYGTPGFVAWMNSTARSLDMPKTHFADAVGISPENVSTTDDLFRFATYLINKKSFIFDITRTPSKKIVADSGNEYQIKNFNLFSDSNEFVGGKVGKTPEAQDTMVSVFLVPINGVARRVAVIVLKSTDYRSDTTNLSNWFTRSAERGARLAATACVDCAAAPEYRKIEQ